MTDTGSAAATAQRSRWRHSPAGTPWRQDSLTSRAGAMTTPASLEPPK